MLLCFTWFCSFIVVFFRVVSSSFLVCRPPPFCFGLFLWMLVPCFLFHCLRCFVFVMHCVVAASLCLCLLAVVTGFTWCWHHRACEPCFETLPHTSLHSEMREIAILQTQAAKEEVGCRKAQGRRRWRRWQGLGLWINLQRGIQFTSCSSFNF